jgi:hypothetical protein
VRAFPIAGSAVGRRDEVPQAGVEASFDPEPRDRESAADEHAGIGARDAVLDVLVSTYRPGRRAVAPRRTSIGTSM